MRLYRWLLRLSSHSLRREYGAAMEETFARRLSDARAAGAYRRIRVSLRELGGLLALALSERWGDDARARRRRLKLESRWKAGRMEALSQEIRHAARRLARSKAFTIASALTLALAIGANASIFAVVERVILNPLPYPDSNRLIELEHGALSLNLPSGIGITPGIYFVYLDRSRSLDGIALYRAEDLTLTGNGEPERIRVLRSTPSLSTVLRVSPTLGRWIGEQEGSPGASPVAVLSHALWMRRYGGDPAIVGRPVLLEGVPTEVIGVMPASFAFPDPRVDIWTAQQLTRAMGYGLWSHDAVARLRDGATIEGARVELTKLLEDLPKEYPSDPIAAGQGKLISTAHTLKEGVIGNVAQALWILLASVGLVLLVACANVANLFLVRSDARQREVAVRRALGACRFGIARYFLTESALLSIAGGGLGLFIAFAAVQLLVALGPTTLPRLHEIRLDWTVVVFTVALSVVAALAFGTIPLLRTAPLAVSLHEIGRGSTASRGRHRARHALMAGQLALALVLLVSSGLMVRSFQKLRTMNPGFDASSALTFRIGLPDRDYSTRDAAVAAHHAIIDRLAALPGVTGVSASTRLPLAGACSGNTLLVEGRALPSGSIPPLAFFRAVAGGYFETMGMRIVRGRSLTRGDIERREPSVVINEALAQRFFPYQDPIGKRVASNRPPKQFGAVPDVIWLTVVGVVANTPTRALAETRPMPAIFMPMSIAGGPRIPRAALLGPDVSLMSYVIRSPASPRSLLTSIRHAIDGIDRSLAIAEVRTLEEVLDRASAQMAFTMVLLAIAASVTLLLGVIGIYGVMSYIVSQRTGEIGVRLALGAAPSSVAAMIVRQGGLVTVAGLAVGLAGALAGGRFIESLLYDVSPRDPGVFALTTATLLCVALIACWLPARRAARLSPLEALRTD